MSQELIANLDETQKLAAEFAKNAKQSDCYCLIGDLGAGKTEFARNFIQALIPNITVPSPTFNIVQIYESPPYPTIYHFDLYRINEEAELEETGLNDALNSGIVLIEWPQIAQDLLPKNRIVIELEIIDENHRKIMVNDGKY